MIIMCECDWKSGIQRRWTAWRKPWDGRTHLGSSITTSFPTSMTFVLGIVLSLRPLPIEAV